jgi:hypothetical protein
LRGQGTKINIELQTTGFVSFFFFFWSNSVSENGQKLLGKLKKNSILNYKWQGLNNKYLYISLWIWYNTNMKFLVI